MVSALPGDILDNIPRQTIVNVDAIRAIWPVVEDGANAAILFNGHPDATMYVADKFDVLRDRLRDLELPMTGRIWGQHP